MHLGALPMQPLPTSVITICGYPQIVLPARMAGHAWSVEFC